MFQSIEPLCVFYFIHRIAFTGENVSTQINLTKHDE